MNLGLYLQPNQLSILLPMTPHHGSPSKQKPKHLAGLEASSWWQVLPLLSTKPLQNLAALKTPSLWPFLALYSSWNTSESCLPWCSILMATLASHSNQTNSESCLEISSCRQLLTLVASKTAQHSADFKCPSLRQLRAFLTARPPLFFLNISSKIFFKKTIQSWAMILIDNHFLPSLIILSTLVSIFPTKLHFIIIVRLSPISSFVLMLKPNWN